MTWPTVAPRELAWIDAPTMREIDRRMIEDVGITLLQMMENAGRSLATVVRAETDPASAVTLAGAGGNGGGGLAAARHLHDWGVEVRVVLTSDRHRLSDAAAHQLSILDWLDIDVSVLDSRTRIDGCDAVIDAMVGYSLRGPLSSEAADACLLASGSGAAVVSLDLPSGVPAAGPVEGPSVAADATVTLCLPKSALADAQGVGRLFVADISVPAGLVEDVTGQPAPPFHRGPILLVG
jgi:NAD(P)H-hydrate epimerase